MAYRWRIVFTIYHYMYKDQVITQVQNFIADPNFGGLWQSVSSFFGDLFDKVAGFVSTVIE